MNEARRESRLSLEVVHGEGPITGSVEDDAGERSSFTGWVGLLSVLQRRLEAAGSRPSRKENR